MKEKFKRIITDFHESGEKKLVQRDFVIPEAENKIITLVGVRRSGKTYMLYSKINQLIKQGLMRNIVYINFEDDRIFPLKLQDLGGIIDGYYELYPDIRGRLIYFFFDEIQQVDGWEKFVRRVLDNETCRIYIAGSSSRMLSREISTTLRGRTIVYEIFPLSFKEYLRFKDIEINMYSSASLSKIVNAFDEYLKRGGFPETVNFDREVWFRTIGEYMDSILYRDIIERYSVKNTFLLKFLLNYLSRNISTLLSVNKLFNYFSSQGLKLSKNTLYEYLEYFEDAYAFFTVPVYSRSIKDQYRNPRKLYAVDIAFKRVSDIQEDMGRVYENIVFLELRKRYRNIFYFKNKHETDFIVPEEKIIINVCFDTSDFNTLGREVKGTQEAMKYFGAKNGFIITGGEEKIMKSQTGKIIFIPLWKWTLEQN